MLHFIFVTIPVSFFSTFILLKSIVDDEKEKNRKENKR